MLFAKTCVIFGILIVCLIIYVVFSVFYNLDRNAMVAELYMFQVDLPFLFKYDK